MASLSLGCGVAVDWFCAGVGGGGLAAARLWFGGGLVVCWCLFGCGWVDACLRLAKSCGAGLALAWRWCGCGLLVDWWLLQLEHTHIYISQKYICIHIRIYIVYIRVYI